MSTLATVHLPSIRRQDSEFGAIKGCFNELPWPGSTLPFRAANTDRRIKVLRGDLCLLS